MQTYCIEILRQAEEEIAPFTALAHCAESDLEAYLSAEKLVKNLNDPLIIGWKLICTANPEHPRAVRLTYEARRIIDNKRDETFFAERRAQEAANRAKTERLRALRLASQAPQPSLPLPGSKI